MSQISQYARVGAPSMSKKLLPSYRLISIRNSESHFIPLARDRLVTSAFCDCDPLWSKASRYWPNRMGSLPSPVRPSRATWRWVRHARSEEHTSELQSRGHLVCRLLLEKKNVIQRN